MVLVSAGLEQRAEEVLREKGLYAAPPDLLELARRLGIKAINAKFTKADLVAILARRGDEVTLLVRETEPPFNKRIALAHGLAHYILGHLPPGNSEIQDRDVDLFRSDYPSLTETSPQERREIETNQLATALLMPAGLVRQEWPYYRSVNQMARRFKVSEEAIGNRIAALRLA